MIALRLVRLIEDHSDELVEGFLQKLRTSEKTKDMAKVPVQELRDRVHEILKNLGDWLLYKKESDEKWTLNLGEQSPGGDKAVVYVNSSDEKAPMAVRRRWNGLNRANPNHASSHRKMRSGLMARHSSITLAGLYM